MKKITFLTLLNLLFVLPITVEADAIAISLTCPPTAKIGQTITCQISSNSEIPINGLTLKYSIPEYITYQKLELTENWQSHYNSKLGLVTTKMNNTNTINKIANLYLKISNDIPTNKNYIISLNDISLSNNNYVLLKSPQVSSTIKILSDNTNLSNLTITNGQLSPTFNPSITNYISKITKDNTTITATASDANSTITGDIGYQKLNYGANIFKITVTSQSGTTKNYTITITRPLPTTTTENKNPNTTKDNSNNKPATKSSDASLKELSINNYYLNFKSTTYNYELKVPSNVNDLDITAIPNDPKSKTTITGQNNLTIGENIITITVTSEDGTTCKYIITVTKTEEKLSNNKEVNDIIIENYDLKFQQNKYNYTLKIKNENKLNIQVKLNDKKANYKITGNENLTNNSIIIITIIAEDNTTQDYTIKIEKEITALISDKTLVFIITTIIIILLLFIIIYKNRKHKKPLLK